MSAVNVHEAKTHFSKLLERVSNGEEVVIAKAGKPVAKLVPIIPTQAVNREPGLLRGKMKIHDSFYDPLPEELLAAFEGRQSE